VITFSLCFFFSSRRRHTRFSRDWSSDVCSSDLVEAAMSPFADAYLLAAFHSIFVVFLGTPLNNALLFHCYALLAKQVQTSRLIQIGRASCRERVEILLVGG